MGWTPGFNEMDRSVNILQTKFNIHFKCSYIDNNLNVMTIQVQKRTKKDELICILRNTMIVVQPHETISIRLI